MPRKKPPVFLYLLIIVGFTAAIMMYGGKLMKRNFIYADVTLDEYGVVIHNRDKANTDWVGGVIYFNEESEDTSSAFGPVTAGTAVRVPFVAFEGIFKDEKVKNFEIKTIIIEMEGYKSKKVREVEPHVLSRKEL